MKINVGCGHLPLDGYLNVDMHAREADVLGDARQMQFQDVDEVVAYHFLEHLGWQDTLPFLTRVHSWMRPGGRIAVEVPDMEKILELGLADGACWAYIYGSQEHEGEFHRSGFTSEMLKHVLLAAEFTDVRTRRFFSRHWVRKGMPCLLAIARA